MAVLLKLEVLRSLWKYKIEINCCCDKKI